MLELTPQRCANELQCWDLAFVWAQLQSNQMQKYVDSNLFTAETSLAGQRWDPRVKGGATDSCHKTARDTSYFQLREDWDEASKQWVPSGHVHESWDLLFEMGGFVISIRLFTVCWGYLDTGGEALNTWSVPYLCSHSESGLLCPSAAWRCYLGVKAHSVNDARIWKAERKYLNECSMALVPCYVYYSCIEKSMVLTVN